MLALFAMGWAVCLTVVSLVLRGFGVKRLAIFFPMAWVVFIVALAALYFPSPKDAQSELIWVFPFVLALPLSFLTVYVRVSGTALEFALLIGLLGSLQYFLIGWGADAIIGAVKRRNTSGRLV